MPDIKTPPVLQTACAEDFEALVTLRIDAMRESLERIGRFSPERARERFRAAFAPERTQHVIVDDERVGFFVLAQHTDHVLLDHLYIKPEWQNRGIGAWVLAHVFSLADGLGLPTRLGALRESAANRFYIRHGFVKTSEGEWDIYYERPLRSG